MDQPTDSIIDAHIHIWDYASYRNTGWLEDRPALKTSFQPPDLQPLLRASGVKEGVIVESDKTSYAYNIWWLEVTEYCPYLRAVILGADLLQDGLKLWLEAFTQWPGCKGIRSSLQGPPKEWAGHPTVSRAMKLLTEYGLALELQVQTDQLDELGVVLEHHPDCQIILDACAALPMHDAKARTQWEELMRLVAGHEHVAIKCSCLPEICGNDPVEGRSLMHFLAETFGANRLIWGSGWPVLPEGQSYQQVLDFSRACLADLSPEDVIAVFGGNARRIYRMP
ncbi:MAG: L-fuconolactonase [Kiritimatiellia bacterium]|jgi:L-fuconolactonase